VQYAWSHEQPAALAVTRVGRLLAVARRGYSAWRGRPPRVHSDPAQPLEAKGKP
jgi:hypothetical protein